jgi:hypothetical protein
VFNNVPKENIHAYNVTISQATSERKLEAFKLYPSLFLVSLQLGKEESPKSLPNHTNLPAWKNFSAPPHNYNQSQSQSPCPCSLKPFMSCSTFPRKPCYVINELSIPCLRVVVISLSV